MHVCVFVFACRERGQQAASFILSPLPKCKLPGSMCKEFGPGSVYVLLLPHLPSLSYLAHTLLLSNLYEKTSEFYWPIVFHGAHSGKRHVQSKMSRNNWLQKRKCIYIQMMKNIGLCSPSPDDSWWVPRVTDTSSITGLLLGQSMAWANKGPHWFIGSSMIDLLAYTSSHRGHGATNHSVRKHTHTTGKNNTLLCC